ncbi:MAG: GIY-YIG nuclease family protein [Paludibacteraceae bacterium]|nr:GIY-YIG nuclease family protein [Paludibacteraceae bacterium]
MAKRNMTRYELRDGNKVVYVGITNDPERRSQEHSVDKDFTRLVPIGPKVSPETAERWEEDRIATYKKNHHGNRPKYNQNDSGK